MADLSGLPPADRPKPRSLPTGKVFVNGVQLGYLDEYEIRYDEPERLRSWDGSVVKTLDLQTYEMHVTMDRVDLGSLQQLYGDAVLQ